MDICHYARIKTFPGGKVSECELYAGVVFQKNVASRRMRPQRPLFLRRELCLN